MSKDRLEKFIIDHRDEFDEFEPNPALFKGIKTHQPVIRRINWNNPVWKVAAVVVIFVSSYFFHDWMSRQSNNNEVAETTNEAPSEIVKMLVEAEAYYTAQISARQEEFNLATSANPEIRHEINYDIMTLDSVYADLRRDLKDNAANEEVIEAMIQNYRLKLEILEDVLSQIQQANNNHNNEEQNHEVNL